MLSRDFVPMPVMMLPDSLHRYFCYGLRCKTTAAPIELLFRRQDRPGEDIHSLDVGCGFQLARFANEVFTPSLPAAVWARAL